MFFFHNQNNLRTYPKQRMYNFFTSFLPLSMALEPNRYKNLFTAKNNCTLFYVWRFTRVYTMFCTLTRVIYIYELCKHSDRFLRNFTVTTLKVSVVISRCFCSTDIPKDTFGRERLSDGTKYAN